MTWKSFNGISGWLISDGDLAKAAIAGPMGGVGGGAVLQARQEREEPRVQLDAMIDSAKRARRAAVDVSSEYARMNEDRNLVLSEIYADGSGTLRKMSDERFAALARRYFELDKRVQSALERMQAARRASDTAEWDALQHWAQMALKG